MVYWIINVTHIYCWCMDVVYVWNFPLKIKFNLCFIGVKIHFHCRLFTDGSIISSYILTDRLSLLRFSNKSVYSLMCCWLYVSVCYINITFLFSTVPPLTVHILGSNQPISASRRYDLLCQSSGSRPPATITWWKNGERINSTRETVSKFKLRLLIGHEIYRLKVKKKRNRTFF